MSLSAEDAIAPCLAVAMIWRPLAAGPSGNRSALAQTGAQPQQPAPSTGG